ncbi:hypothetical protein ACQEVB_05580 [Pseudonocardia sp. CA-107938]|uniref:hypothetical protein n=1 Tax=Pseudonocardia sp. CA-107938 TaxID=3240021 RepID=UPI003D8ED61C
MATSSAALEELGDRLNAAGFALPTRWPLVHEWFRDWSTRWDLRHDLRDHLGDLSADSLAAISNRSRETTTHYKWCLRDVPGEEFTFWLHQYKPQRDWRVGYADSVHNHRYHFCTTLLRGEYQHERYTAVLDPSTGLISSVTEVRSTRAGVGTTGYLLASDFHRVSWAGDDAMTFLVKSRPQSPWSLSYDPETRVAHRHLSVDARLVGLAADL